MNGIQRRSLVIPLRIPFAYCSMPTDISLANSEKNQALIAIIELHWSESISKSVS